MSGSKFAVLRVDDDSDTENKNIAFGCGMQQVSKGKKTGATSQKKAELILHSVERQRPKVKKNKNKVVDPVTGYVLQEDLDLKKQEVREAITRSSSDTSSPTEFGVDSKEGSSKSREGYTVLSSEEINGTLAQCVKQMELTNDELAKSRSKADYYKDRYKKLFELFKEAEFADRAKLVADLQRSQANVIDLTDQLAIVTAQLEQARSRLGVYEGKK